MTKANPTPIPFRLRLQGHCIETAAKKARRALSERLLRSEEGDGTEIGDLEKNLNLLDRFLDGADFRKIRNEIPLFDGRADVVVLLREKENAIFLETEDNGGPAARYGPIR